MTAPATAPATVGLCPGEHLGAFYVPLEVGEELAVCPECSEPLIVYAPTLSPGRRRSAAIAAAAASLKMDVGVCGDRGHTAAARAVDAALRAGLEASR